MKLEIISVEKTRTIENIDYVSIPSFNGEMGIQKGHAKTVVLLKKGVIRINTSGKTINLPMFSEGAAVINNNIIRILIED